MPKKSKATLQGFYLLLFWIPIFLAVKSECSELPQSNFSIKHIFENHNEPYLNKANYSSVSLATKKVFRALDDSLTPITCSLSVSEDYHTYNLTFSKNITITTLTKSLFSVTMPGLTEPDDYEFNVTRLPDSCCVQINFNFTTTLSWQLVTITFHHNNQFLDPYPQDSLSTTVTHHVPFKLGTSATMIDNAIRTGCKIIFGIATGSLLICFFTKERATILWSMLDFLQMIYGLFFINTELPWNLRAAVIGSAASTLNFVPNPFEKLGYPPNNSTSYMFGPEQVSFLYCMWPWLILLIGIGTVQAIIYIAYKLSKVSPESQARIEPYLNLVHWSGLFRLFTVGFLPLLIAIAVQFALLSEDPLIIAGAAAGGVTSLGFVVIILVFAKILSVRIEKLRDDDYRARFVVLYEGQKLRKKVTKYWIFVDIFRKTIYCIALGAGRALPLAQSGALVGLNVMYFALFVFFRPFVRAKYNAVITIREGFLIAVNGMILILVVDDQIGFLNKGRLTVGWAAVICATIVYVVHSGWFVLDALISLNKKKPLPTEESTPKSTKLPAMRMKRYSNNPLNQSQLNFISGKRDSLNQNQEHSKNEGSNYLDESTVKESPSFVKVSQADNVSQVPSMKSEDRLSEWRENPNTHRTRIMNILKMKVAAQSTLNIAPNNASINNPASVKSEQVMSRFRTPQGITVVENL